MALYCGMDLHSTNTYVVVLDEGRVQLERRIPNQLELILRALKPFRPLRGIAVESTFNWYWLVDGLMDADYRVQLVNTNAVQQYDGLKFTDDRHDGRWLAELLRLGILPTGYIYPKEDRPIRDLLRRRCRLVQKRTGFFLSTQNLLARNTGHMLCGNALTRLSSEEVHQRIADPHLFLAIDANLAVIDSLNTQIHRLEKAILRQARTKPALRTLRSIPGIGQTLGLTIMYETGQIERFSKVGNYTSYCRCVPSERRSNQKKKGEGNRKNGNAYLAWAFGEAAVFIRRFEPRAQRYYDRKKAKTCQAVAGRALAHKLARASYFMMRDQTLYEPARLFG